MMRQRKSRIRIFKSERSREWAIDFMIGIGMFVLVAIFASTHTDSALPAPLAKTQAVLEQNAVPPRSPAYAETLRTMQFVSSQDLLHSASVQTSATSNNNFLLFFMGLAFSGLLTMTFQFWRNFRRAYASPRRGWGKG